MALNTHLKESVADPAIQSNGANEAQLTTVAKRALKASSARLPSRAPSCHATRGTRLLAGGAWTLVVIQVLAVASQVIYQPTRDTAIEAVLSGATSSKMAGALGLFLALTSPGIAALLGGLALYKRTNGARGKSLSTSAAVAVLSMVGLQFMPTSSFAGWGIPPAPSERLVGLWKSDNDPFRKYVEYGPTNSVSMGTCYARNGSPLFTFRVLSEEGSGTKLITREYLNGIAMNDAEYSVSKDGRSMTKDYVFKSGSRALCKYRRPTVTTVHNDRTTRSSHGSLASPGQTLGRDTPGPKRKHLNRPKQNLSSPNDELYALLSEGQTTEAQPDTIVITDGAVINGFKIKYIDTNTVIVERNGDKWMYQLEK